MRTSLSVGQLAVAFLSLSPAVHAWPRWMPERDSLIVRQDEGSQSPAPTPAPSASPSDNQNEENSASSTPRGRTTGNLNTGGQTPTGSASRSGSAAGSRTSSGKPQSTFGNSVPPGNVVMVTPAITMDTQLYKIDVDTATWVWNYTNVLGTPTAVDVLVTNSVANKVWTLTSNMTFDPTGNRFEWDLKQGVPVQTPLLEDEYTLIIHASDKDRNDQAQPGYLGTYSLFRFGLYEKRPYVDNGDGYKCAACNAASGGFRGAVGVAVMTSLLTVATFTSFVVGVGAI